MGMGMGMGMSKAGMSEPASGVLRDRVHTFPTRVYYEDTDAGGVVYHTGYLRWAERARTELMRLLGFNHGFLLAGHKVSFAMRRCSAEFRLPARLDDALEVRTRVIKVRGASFDGRQDIVRDDTMLVQLDSTLACITPDGRPAPIPGELRAALASLCLTEGRL